MLRSLRPARQTLLRATQQQQRRNLSIHEYQSYQLLNDYGIPTPAGKPARTPQEAFDLTNQFEKEGKNVVVKAQVLAGGRGKGHFDSGFQGGVHMADSAEQAKELADKMLGHKLITKQTGAGGRICNAVMIAERTPKAKEYYAAVLSDRARGCPVIVASNQGGMNIEDVAHDTPEAIITTNLDFDNGIDHAAGVKLAEQLGFAPEARDNAAEVFQRLYTIFKEKDATQIEINPLGEFPDGQVLCMDAKFGFDDNADFRQKDVFELRDKSQEDPDEVKAAEFGLNFIKLDGDIGCLVNGAGLAMATMDVLNLHGGSPANFLDVGGGATAEAVKEAFKLILSAPQVKSIFVNIFGGIMRCDVIAEGIIKATTELDLTIPVVVRLQGTREAEAKKLIKESGLKIYANDNLDDAAAEAVKLAHDGAKTQ